MGKIFKNIDDVFDELEKTKPKDIKDAFKKYDEYSHDDTQNQLYNDVMVPGLKNMYESFTGSLKKTFKKDTEKLYGKKKEIKKAAIEGMKKFFETASPEIFDSVKGIKDEEELYDRLVSAYDEHTGANVQKGEGIDNLIANYAENKTATFGHLKKTLHKLQSAHADGALRYLQGRHISAHLGHYRTHKVAGHVIKEIESRPGYSVDKGVFAKKDLYGLINAREGVIKGKYAKDTDLEQDGITYSAPKPGK